MSSGVEICPPGTNELHLALTSVLCELYGYVMPTRHTTGVHSVLKIGSSTPLTTLRHTAYHHSERVRYTVGDTMIHLFIPGSA